MGVSQRQLRMRTLPVHLLQLGVTRFAVRRVGFARTLRAIRSLSTTRRARRITQQEANRVAEEIARAAAFYPGRARCLEQSLVLYFCLRRRGVAAELRIGVQPYGFRAHSWVEYEGVPVNENGEVVRAVVPFPTLGI